MESPRITQAAFDAWQQTITNTLTELGQQLLTPILFTLPSSVQRLILLPSAELFLLPLHAAPLADNDSEQVCDRYEISYAPSIEVLANVRAKATQRVIPKLYAVINPGGDPHLVFTPAEGAALAQLFPQSQRAIDTGSEGTKQRVLVGVQGQTY